MTNEDIYGYILAVVLDHLRAIYWYNPENITEYDIAKAQQNKKQIIGIESDLLPEKQKQILAPYIE